MSDHDAVKIGIVGGGVVGSAIAYRLSQESKSDIQVFERGRPGELQATGAALGVLIAGLGSKLKGRHVRLRLQSLQLMEAWIPALESATQQTIPYNRNGILHLCFDAETFSRWAKTEQVRQRQGIQLQRLSASELNNQFPELALARSLNAQPLVGAVYSPQDRQVSPRVLTQRLVTAAQQQGTQFHFETEIVGFHTEQVGDQRRVTHLKTPGGAVPVDWVVLAAGLGAAPLSEQLQQPIPLRPVLGQAMKLVLPDPLPVRWPVVNGLDVHLVPLDDRSLWVGATVEFPPSETEAPIPNPEDFRAVYQQAIAFYPPLAEAEVVETWQGFRPRPSGRAAPVIESLPGYTNVIFAAGHYRNGVLLAPITAETIAQRLQERISAKN